MAVGLLGALGALVLVIGVVGTLALRPAAPGSTDAPAREWRRVRLTRWVGLLVGLLAAAAGVVTGTGHLGTGWLLAPAVLGSCVLLATALGETLVRAPREPGPRTASLATRRVRDLAPRRLGAAVGTALVLLVATATFTTATAGPDDLGRGGRALVCTSATSLSARTPYPGWSWTLPLLGLLLVVLAVAVLAALAVVRRPRGAGHDDDALRRRSLTVVVAATGVAVGAQLAGVAGVTASAMAGLSSARPSCAPGWYDTGAVVLAVVALAAGVLAVVCAVRVLVGPEPLPAPDRAAAR